MSWSRRDFLRCAGSAAGTALLACGGASRVLRTPSADDDELGRALAEAVAELSPRWPSARGLARRHVHAAAASDVQGGKATQTQHAVAILTIAGPTGDSLEHAVSALDRASLLGAARALGAEASARGLGAGPAADPPDAAAVLAAPPAAKLWSPQAMAEHVAALAERADLHGSSRVIYRGAGLDLDVTTSWHAAGGALVRHTQTRQRSAVAIVAWNGEALRGQELDVGLTLPATAPALVEALSEAELTGAVERLLRLTTPEPLPAGVHDVILDGSLVASLCSALSGGWARAQPATRRALAGALASAPWRLRWAPTAPAAYGGCAIDDRGHGAIDRAIFADQADGPAPRGAFLREGLWGTPGAPLRHLVLEAPGASDAALSVDRGYLVEGAMGAFVDLDLDTVVLRARVARELRGGATTGRAYADVVVRSSAGELLRALAAFGATAVASCARLPTDAGPVFASAEVPAALARVSLFPRRVQ